MARLLIAKSDVIRKQIDELDEERAWLQDLLKAAVAREARESRNAAPAAQAEPEKPAVPEPAPPAEARAVAETGRKR